MATGEPGHGKAPCPGSPHCVNCSGAHVKGPFRNFISGKVFSFWMPRGSSLKLNFRPGLKCYATTLRCPLGVDAITQTEAIPSKSKQSCSTAPSQITVSCKIEISTHTGNLSNLTVPGARMCLHSGLMHDTQTPRTLHQKLPVRKQCPQSRSGL